MRFRAVLLRRRYCHSIKLRYTQPQATADGRSHPLPPLSAETAAQRGQIVIKIGSQRNGRQCRPAPPRGIRGGAYGVARSNVPRFLWACLAPRPPVSRHAAPRPRAPPLRAGRSSAREVRRAWLLPPSAGLRSITPQRLCCQGNRYAVRDTAQP